MQPYVRNLQPYASQVERAASLQQATALLRESFLSELEAQARA